MKKLISLLLAIILVLAISSTALAVDIPAGKISLTAQAVDYTYALAGYAQPVSKTYVANERYAVLVSIEIPGWMDTGGLALEVTPKNCTAESVDSLVLTNGDYVIMGTVLAPGATLKVTVKDKALDTADTANELWAALYGDRSVSATATLGVAAATQAAVSIPKTGGREDIAWAGLCLLLSAGCWAVIIYNGIGIWAYLRDKRRRRNA